MKRDWSMCLLDGEQATEQIRQYARSRDWWIILAASEMGSRLAMVIEDAHYRGKASGDFHVLVCGIPGGGLAAIFFARKKRMTKAQLARLIGQDSESLSDEQDVLIDADEPRTVLAWLSAVVDGEGQTVQ